jgi:hypothetical protein
MPDDILSFDLKDIGSAKKRMKDMPPGMAESVKDTHEKDWTTL